MVTQIAVGINVSIQGDGLDAQFLAELGNTGVAVCHGSLGQSDLCLRQREFSTTSTPSGARGLKAGHGSLPDELTFELGERGKNAEGEPPGCGCRVDLRALPRQHLQSDTAIRKVGDGLHQVMEAPAETIEFPDHEHIAVAEGLEASLQTGALIFLSRNAVRVDLALLDARHDQGVVLQIELLAPICFGDPCVSNQHVS